MNQINAGTETVNEAVSVLLRIRSGKPLYEIAAEEGISVGEAGSRLNAELVEEKKNKDNELKNKITALFEKGVIAEEISKELAIPFNKVKNIIRSSGAYQNDIIGFDQMQKEQFIEENPDAANTLSLKEREDRYDAVAEAFAKGKNIKEIAKQFYLKPGMVYFILRNKGIPLKRKELRINKERKAPNRRYDDEFVQHVIATYRELKSIRKTAEKLNTLYFAIYKILRNNNLLQPKIYRKKLQATGNEELINELMNAHNEKLTITEISERTGMSRGSVKKFLIKNNLAIYTTPTINSKNKKIILIAYLREKAELLGRAPFKHELVKNKVHNYMQYYRAFGSYKKALEAAELKNGVQYKKEKRNHYKAELQNELLRIAREINRIPEREDISKCSKYPMSEFERNFRSLRDACRKAGLELKNVSMNKSSNEELIRYLRDLALRYGSTPTISLLKKDKRYNSILFSRRFGSWNIALLTAGFTPSKIVEVKPVNRDELLMRVKEYIKQHGVPLRDTLMRDCKLTEFNLYRFFGDYKKLIKEATEGV